MGRILKATLAAAAVWLGGAALVAADAAPAYVVSEAEVSDRAAYQTYIDRAAALIEAAGGRFLVRGGKTASVAGEPPKRVTIYMFDSMEKAEAFFASAAYKELVSVRDTSSKWRGLIVEGLAP